jgi:hypothetical protein
MMNKRILGFITVGTAVAFGAALMINQPEKQYVPRYGGEENMAAAGAWEYLNSRRANQETGLIDNKDVQAALQGLDLMALNKTSALNLTWDFAGPDNVGGRTRAFLIDRTNTSTLYAAGVAGGVFKSTNAGLSWISMSNGLTSLAVVSLTQASNGDIYAGTGENLYAPTNGFGTATSPGMTGGGIFKSTDGGANWSVLPSTVPPSNTNSNLWSAIGDLGADPTNANRIYAATDGGLRRSDDGGLTWVNPVPTSVAAGGRTSDLDVGSDGSIWFNVGERMIYSPSGNDNSFVEISEFFASATALPRNGGRTAFTVSPQDNDVVYVCQTFGNALSGVYRTTDRGATWTKIGTKTALFDPFCSDNSCQGNWDLLLEVDPLDKNHIFVGGIRLWEWKQTSGWRRVDGFGSFYVHADKHRMRFNPNNSNIVYALTDGGVGKSSDAGFTWGVFNKNYSTGQFYQMGFGQDRVLVGGTQDNGSVVVDGKGNTPFESRSLGGIAYQNGGFHAGDGGYNLISWLDDDIYFTSYQLGTMGRSENKGESYTSFWDPRQLTTCQPWYGRTCSFSSWMIPYELYETTNDPLSADSVLFVARSAISSLGFGGGSVSFTSTLNKPQSVSVFVTSSFKIVSGSLTVVSDASGNLSGDGNGTFDPQTGNYSVTFSSVPLAEIVITCDIRYTAGSTIEVNSNTNALPFKHTITANLSPNDSLKIQDPVQSIFVTGLNGTLWMTRGSLDFSTLPRWYKIAQFSGTTQSVAISSDGKYVWAGTENGRVIRVNNIELARSVKTGDIDDTNSVVTFSQVANFGGRNITGISVSPTNPDHVVVTVGNYGNTNYVYYSSNATSANPTFTPKQGNLPAFPVYCATFDKANPNTVIIGTEYGIFATENISAASVNWNEENNGMQRVPVFSITQYRTDRSSTSTETIEEGDIFIGTHARGFFRSTTLMSTRPIGITEEKPVAFADRAQLSVYPNPATDYTQLALNLVKTSDVTIFVRDINGRLVNQMKFSRMAAGEKEIRISTDNLASGTYFITAQIGDQVKSGKFAVVR